MTCPGLRSAFLLALALVLATGGCASHRSHPRPLAESEGVELDRLLDVIGAWGEVDDLGRRVEEALRSARREGRVSRARMDEFSIMAVTAGDRVFLADRFVLDPAVRRADLRQALAALTVLVHEGIHLLQSDAERVLGCPEEDAYRRTHAFDRWLLAAWIDGQPLVREIFPAADLASLGEIFAEVRAGTGGDFLADLDPVHRVREIQDSFLRTRGSGPEPLVGHLLRSWPLRRDRVRIGEQHPGLLSAPPGEEAPRYSFRFQVPFDAMPKATTLRDPRGGPRFVAAWYLVRERTSGEDRTDEWNRDHVSLEYDDRIASAPRLRIRGPLPAGDYDVVWRPHRLSEIGAPRPVGTAGASAILPP